MKKLLVFLLLMAMSGKCFANVAFVNTNTAGQVSTASTKTVAMTVNAGANAAFVCLGYDLSAGLSVNSVTYNGVSMIAAGTASTHSSGHPYSEIYYLINPSTGSNNLVITMSATVTDIYYNLIAFSGVNATTPVRAGTYQNLINQAQPTMVITSNTNDLTMSCTGNATFAISSTTQTSDGINNTGTYAMGSDHATTAASSVTHTWSPGSANISMVGLSIDGDANTVVTVPTSITINNARINNAKIGY